MAQDSHYWSHKFGPKNTLLSGSDDATGRDNAAIVNNPGGLGFITNNSLSITMNAYSLNNSKFIDGAGHGLHMKYMKPNVIPLILSATYKHPKFKRWTAGYVLIDKERFNFKSSQRYDGEINVINDNYSYGAEEFVSQIDVQNNLSEMWGGIAVAYQLNEKWSIGIASFGAYREHTNRFQYTARAIINNTTDLVLASTNVLYNISYYNVRSISKIGVSGSIGETQVGVSVTLPSISVYSQGVINSDITGQNVLLNPTQNKRDNFIANDRQVNLRARYKSPASIGLGLSRSFGSATCFYLNAEYFMGMRPYSMITPKPTDFIRPKGVVTVTSSDLLKVAGGAVPVINLAMGFQQHLFKSYDMLFGLRTDNSYYNKAIEDHGIDMGMTQTSIYHGTLGIMTKRPKSDIYLGVKVSYGRGPATQFANINAPADNILMMGDTGTGFYRYYALAGMLGYVHHLN